MCLVYLHYYKIGGLTILDVGQLAHLRALSLLQAIHIRGEADWIFGGHWGSSMILLWCWLRNFAFVVAQVMGLRYVLIAGLLASCRAILGLWRSGYSTLRGLNPQVA